MGREQPLLPWTLWQAQRRSLDAPKCRGSLEGSGLPKNSGLGSEREELLSCPAARRRALRPALRLGHACVYSTRQRARSLGDTPHSQAPHSQPAGKLSCG